MPLPTLRKPSFFPRWMVGLTLVFQPVQALASEPLPNTHLAAPLPGEAQARSALAGAREAGSHEVVIEKLEPMLEHLGVLRPWGELLLAEALLEAGRRAEVPGLLAKASKVDPAGPIGKKAAALEALLLLEDPAAKGSEEALLRLLRDGHGDGPRLRLALGRRLLSLERKSEAAGTLRILWRQHPEREEAREAEALLASLGVSPSWHDRQQRIQRLLSAGQAEEALREIARGGAVPKGLQGAILLLQARALSDAGRRPEAEAVLGELLKTRPAADQQGEALLLLGRLAARRQALEEAVAHLDGVAKISSGKVAAEAAFLASFLFYDFGRYDDAVERFATYSSAHRHRLEEASWFRGWALFLQGKLGEAEKEFASHLRAHPKGQLAPQVLYWRGRTLEKLDRLEEAKALYLLGAKRSPADWYAFLSTKRLGDRAPGLVVRGRKAQGGPPAGRGLPERRLARAEALYEVGWASEAGEELDAATKASQDRDFLLAAARLALQGGDPSRAYRLSPRLGGLAAASDLSFPQAYPEELAAAASASGGGVDPLLLLSIMRQESGFSPDIRSPRGAVGLMQLLPSTATRLVARMGMDSPGPSPLDPGRLDPSRLEDPRTNLTLGATYLAALLERFGGNEALAIAAYNAGPAAVAGWLEDPLRATLPLDEWVESIPWRETRGYVKVVFTNFITYRSLHGGPIPTLPLALPPPGPGIDF